MTSQFNLPLAVHLLKRERGAAGGAAHNRRTRRASVRIWEQRDSLTPEPTSVRGRGRTGIQRTGGDSAGFRVP